jgi:hypothetical protein
VHPDSSKNKHLFSANDHLQYSKSLSFVTADLPISLADRSFSLMKELLMPQVQAIAWQQP